MQSKDGPVHLTRPVTESAGIWRKGRVCNLYYFDLVALCRLCIASSHAGVSFFWTTCGYTHSKICRWPGGQELCAFKILQSSRFKPSSLMTSTQAPTSCLPGYLRSCPCKNRRHYEPSIANKLRSFVACGTYRMSHWGCQLHFRAASVPTPYRDCILLAWAPRSEVRQGDLHRLSGIPLSGLYLVLFPPKSISTFYQSTTCVR